MTRIRPVVEERLERHSGDGATPGHAQRARDGS